MPIEPSGKRYQIAEGNPALGLSCPGCWRQFQVGEFAALIAIGPGADQDERRKAAAGLPYSAVAVPVHWVCATGQEEQPEGMVTLQ